MQALRTLIEAPELHAGAIAGAVALLVGALVVLGLRAGGRGTGSRPGIVGPLLVAATVAAIGGIGPFEQVWPVPARIALALVALWVAGEIGARTAAPVGAVLALAGGLALVDPAAHFPGWVAAILVLGPAVAGTTAADLDRRDRREGLGPLLLLVSIGALYTTVPDTELALVLLGAAVPVTLLAWPRPWARLGAGGSYAAVGLFLWVATLEGSGRAGSVVGAVATLALLVAEPIGRALAPHVPVDRLPDWTAPEADGRVPKVALVVAQLLLAAYAARVAGLVDSPLVALALALPVLAIGTAVGARAAVPLEPRAQRTARRRRDLRSDPVEPPGPLPHDDRRPRGDPSMN